MKSYEKPVAVVNDEISEGVYVASGDGDTTADCWTITPTSVQDWSGSHHVFEVLCVHSTSVEHISSKTTAVFTFSHPLTDAYSEFHTDSFSGNTLTVERELHANAYKSGDTVTYKIWVSTGDEATTKAITCTGATITCKHETNVQGKYD